MTESAINISREICVQGDAAKQKLQGAANVVEGGSQEVDDAILHAQGHKAALTRHFNWISALGLAFSVTNSWVGYLVRTNHAGAPRNPKLVIKD
jgi:hypothetical protein